MSLYLLSLLFGGLFTKPRLEEGGRGRTGLQIKPLIH